jgi:hypothetical protein
MASLILAATTGKIVIGVVVIAAVLAVRFFLIKSGPLSRSRSE